MNALAPLPCQLLFLDEMSCDSHAMYRKKGWFLKGSTLYYHVNFTQTNRISLLCFLRVDGMVDFFMIDNTFTHKIFFHFIIQLLHKGVIESYPSKYNIWVMDGAAIYMDPVIIDFLFSIGIFIIFLSPYCPF